MSRYFDSKSAFRHNEAREELDPMSSLANMADVMLVFACGLMVALVVAWNVPLNTVQEVETDKELSDDQIEQIEDQRSGNGFVEMGKVYQDPETGKYYLVEDQ